MGYTQRTGRLTAAIRHSLIVCLVGLAGLKASAQEGLYPIVGVPVLEDAVTVREPRALPAPTQRFRVAFYNIEHFTDGIDDGNHRSRQDAERQARGVAALLDAVRPDLAIFSEIESDTCVEMVNRSLARPFPGCFITSFDAGNSARMNIALLTRLPILEAREIDFHTLMGPGRPPRGALRVIARLSDGHKLLIYGVHLKSNVGEKARNMVLRRNAAELIANNARELMESEPETQWEAMIIGDMNIDPWMPAFVGDTSLLPFRAWSDLWLLRPGGQVPTLPGEAESVDDEGYYDVTFDRVLVNAALRDPPWVAGWPEVFPYGHEAGARLPNGQRLADPVSDHLMFYFDITRSAP